LEINEVDIGSLRFSGAVPGEMPHLTTFKAGPPWRIAGAPSPSSIMALGPSRFIQGGDSPLKSSASVGSGPVDIHRDWHVIHILGGGEGIPWLSRLTSTLPVVVALVSPIEWLPPVVVRAKRGRGGRGRCAPPFQDVVDSLMSLHCIDGSLLQVLVSRGCPSLYDIFQDVAGQPL
jgi:hypothetical protein